MSIAIHHGPPGSYKTFAIIQRHIIEALAAGRTVITNIRGFDDIERVKQYFPEKKIPKSAKILTLLQKEESHLELIRRWWHWAPFGSLVVIDEAQMVYPQRREFQLKHLDSIDSNLVDSLGIDVETTFNGEIRPTTLEIAFDMHRHFNFDLFLSTPNIGKIHKQIRQSAEWAYRHRDISNLIPFYKNRWSEIQHDAEFTGKSPSHIVGSPTRYKADPRVWETYKSTATGQHSASVAGRAIYKDPKILALGVVLSISFTIFFSKLSEANLYGLKEVDSVDVAAGQVSASASVSDDRVNASAGVGYQVNNLGHTDKLILDIPTINRLVAVGIIDSDLARLPSFCRIGSKSVVCKVSHYEPIQSAVCVDTVCHVLIPRYIPPPDVES